MTRPHWDYCITHLNGSVAEFVQSYFSEKCRRCLLVAGAGFDPRSQRVPDLLAAALGDRLSAIFIREERRQKDQDLLMRADANEAALKKLVPDARVEIIDVFADDGAAIGGPRIAALLDSVPVDDRITDVILDMSALSIGIGFPAAKILLEDCEDAEARTFHLLIVSNPELDDRILSEPADGAMSVKGFSGTGRQDTANIWLPQLAEGRRRALARVGAAVGECYKICPVLPFPARDPRRADDLISEFENELVNEWEVDPRDIVYVSEWNPLDSYRSISLLKSRYDQTVKGTFEPQMILSPVGSKVVAVGALMAAIEHDLTVKYIETVQYELKGDQANDLTENDQMVHVLLSGPAYGDYGAVAVPEES